MKISIEKRLNSKGDKLNLRLAYLFGSYTVFEDGKKKTKHKRKIENLNLFLYSDPQNRIEKQHNKETELLAETIRAKRITEAAAGLHGFSDSPKGKTRFYDFYRELMETKRNGNSLANYKIWDCALIRLKTYHPSEGLTFDQISQEWIEGFKQFLKTKALTKSGNVISNGTQYSYFNKLRETLKAAAAKGLIQNNPMHEVKGIKQVKTDRTYLNIDEVRALVKTDCRYDVLKRAFLFSCLTGLRWSDVNKLEWSDLSIFDEQYRLTFSHKKTENLQYLDITQQAFSLMGERKESGRVFEGLKYSAYMNTELLRWALAAGITKHMTFHTGRHTFAVNLISNGVDIYTVSRLLGHSEIRVTMIYADIIDQARQQAIHKIPDIGL